MRMDAYYYGFEPTGDEHIDRILSAIAWAGNSRCRTHLVKEQNNFLGRRSRNCDWENRPLWSILASFPRLLIC